MNIFKQTDPSGKFSKENYVSKHYPEEYQQIINYCNDNNLDDLPFKQKLYHALYDIKSIVICEHPNCANPVNYRNLTKGYYHHCSLKCSNNDTSVLNTKMETCMKKYGVKYPALNDDIKKNTQQIYDNRDKEFYIIANNKRKETIQDRYDVDNVAQIDDVVFRQY